MPNRRKTYRKQSSGHCVRVRKTEEIKTTWFRSLLVFLKIMRFFVLIGNSVSQSSKEILDGFVFCSERKDFHYFLRYFFIFSFQDILFFYLLFYFFAIIFIDKEIKKDAAVVSYRSSGVFDKKMNVSNISTRAHVFFFLFFLLFFIFILTVTASFIFFFTPRKWSSVNITLSFPR